MTIKEQLANNIVGHWDFRTGSLVDQSGNGNYGTFISDATWGNSKRGRCIAMNGVLGSIDVAANSAIDNLFATGGTYTTWVNSKGVGLGGFGRLADKSAGGGWTLYNQTLVSGKLRLVFNLDFSGTDGNWQTTTEVLPINQWSQVVVVYNASSVTNDPKVYVNGNSVAITETVPPVGSMTDDSGSTLRFGNLSNIRTFDGLIGGGIMFDTELTPQQVSQLYNESSQEAHLNKIPTKTVLPEQTAEVGSPVLKLNMNKIGATVYDVTNNGNNGDVDDGILDVEGLHGRALQFNGTGRIEIADSASLDFGDEFLSLIHI